MREQYRHMMERVTLDEDKKEEIMNQLREAKPARRFPRPLRTALIAACACLLLMGSAFAAVYAMGGFASVELQETESGKPGYGLTGGDFRFLSAESLTDEVLALAETDPAYATRYFIGQDWSAAEAFSGVTLPENPVIDALDIGGCFLSVQSNDAGPTWLHFQQWTRGLAVSISAEAYTDLMGEALDPEDFFVGRYFAPGYELSTEEYITRSGLSAVIVHLAPGDGMPDPEKYNTCERYEADLMLDGFRYHINIDVDGSSEEALEQLHGILEGFAL